MDRARPRPAARLDGAADAIRSRHVSSLEQRSGLELLLTNYGTSLNCLFCLLARRAENDTDDRGDHTCRPAYVWCSPRLSERTSRNQVDVALPAGEKTGAVQASARQAGPTAAKTNSRQDQQPPRPTAAKTNSRQGPASGGIATIYSPLLRKQAQASLHAAGDRSNSGVGAFAVPYGSDDRAPVRRVSGADRTQVLVECTRAGTARQVPAAKLSQPRPWQPSPEVPG